MLNCLVMMRPAEAAWRAFGGAGRVSKSWLGHIWSSEGLGVSSEGLKASWEGLIAGWEGLIAGWEGLGASWEVLGAS